jgi:hypothetical protein
VAASLVERIARALSASRLWSTWAFCGCFFGRFADEASIKADKAINIRGFDGGLSEKPDKSNRRSDQDGFSGL